LSGAVSFDFMVIFGRIALSSDLEILLVVAPDQSKIATEEHCVKDRTIRPRRSFIFSPGLKPDMFAKALASGADIVCVELEDGIAPKDKNEARTRTLALFEKPQVDDGIERIVRINCLRDLFGLADVQAILATDSPPPALMIPKVKTRDELVWLDELLTERGHDTRLHVIIETNSGLEAVYEIARASNRIDALFFGGVDMAAELRCKNDWDSLLYARSRVVHAAANAGLDVIDVPFLDLEDSEGMEREAIRARDLGFCGKGSIHPKQIAALNKVFTPSNSMVERARRIIQTFEEADTGLVVIDGKLIEKPVLREMHRILAIAERVAE
jgi:(S)-citramalyl-CoA lyase